VSNAPSSFTASGGRGALTISADRECAWSVTPEAAWVTLADASQGQGEAVVHYAVASNPAPSARTGSMAIGSEHVQVSQAAAPCTYELSRSSDSIGAAGGGLSVGVSTLSGCSWTAAADAAWITVSGSTRSGSSSATVTLQIGINNDAARAGHVIIGGQTYTIEQAGKGNSPAAPDPEPTPAPTTISLEGKASFVTGRCPDIGFYVDSRLVVASAETEFRKGRCGDLSNGDNVKVSGTLRQDNGVDAKQIEIKKK
jgi:hypothetical protein